MLFKIISIESVNDRKFGKCTKICGNKKPKGIKSILPYSRVSNEYNCDTYKFFVDSNSQLVSAASKAKLFNQYLDINIENFTQDFDHTMDDIVMDIINRYSDIEENYLSEDYDSLYHLDDIQENETDIFEEYRQIMFLDLNQNEQLKQYNVMATSTMNGYVNGNYNFSIIAKSQEDALSQVTSYISRMENRIVQVQDLLSCVITPA